MRYVCCVYDNLTGDQELTSNILRKTHSKDRDTRAVWVKRMHHLTEGITEYFLGSGDVDQAFFI